MRWIILLILGLRKLEMDKLRMRLAAFVMCSAWIAAAQAQTATLGSCVTRTVNANYAGATWMAQQVCQGNEVAVSANGFCSRAGRMVGASTTSGTADRSVWLWCSQSGPAVWYAMCCQSQPAPKAVHSCVTRTAAGNYAGTTWMPQHVCQGSEIAVSGGGFCSQAGQMVGASTTAGTANRDVWLWCSQSGPAIWYGVCCQQ